MYPLSIENIERVMVFGAHPDDEIIGPGGTIHKLSENGKNVYVVTFTYGGTAARTFEEMEEMKERRKEEMRSSDEILGISERIVLGYSTQNVYEGVFGSNQLHHELIRAIREYKPDIIFSHMEDNHRDHNAVNRITYESVFQATEHILLNLGDPWYTSAVFLYGIEMDFNPDFVIEISEDDLRAKVEALKTQVSQTRDGYIDRLVDIIESRSRLLGSKYFGSNRYAEGFVLHDRWPMRVR